MNYKTLDNHSITNKNLWVYAGYFYRNNQKTFIEEFVPKNKYDKKSFQELWKPNLSNGDFVDKEGIQIIWK